MGDRKRLVTMSVNAPVTITVVVVQDEEDDPGDSSWEIAEVRNVRANDLDPRALGELMDEGELKYLDGLAAKAKDLP